ncbi:LysR family transcriptional regulator [Pseudomonas knackmussii B13]|uniref:LysR family transcriptional regulator n=1 Tax=Pseudomonas knackmussii (strain DSM 6978 / CCUG 54928 / LMG 23759 / B13) TaxID=1301098 RepID=A0A024HIL0_PSEKB|nr:LysR substrate-binding domain-containing protein [Pseudomonas knackmussii]CDF84342.1 LysR family transcriptional regulator [Pseudomonas knackmussii B13]
MLDPTLLRSFVMVVDAGNFTRAGELLHLTQSTVSQQILRLEEQLGCRLLERGRRQVLPTESGERLLGYARRILQLGEEAREALGDEHSEGVLRLGLPEDFAGERMMPLLAAFAAQRPHLRLEVSSGLSHELLRQYRDGELDVALVKQWGADSDCLARWPEPLCWLDSATQPASLRDPLPLVAFPQGALYRQEMIHALEAQGRRWRIAYGSAGLASLCAAVTAGLGVSLLPRRCLQGGMRELGADEGFPLVDGLELALYARDGLAGSGRSLCEQLRELCDQAPAVIPARSRP